MNWKEKYPQYVTKNGGVKPTTPVEIKQEIFILRASEIHNNRYDYSQVVYVNNSTKVTIICPKHGPWESIPNNHTTFKNGCRRCHADSLLRPLDRFIEEATAIHGKLYDYSSVNYTGAHNKVKITCKEHGEFLQSPNAHLKGQRCPICARNGSESNLVYIFSDPIGNYKIGIAHDINKRKKQQESSSGIALCVVAYKELPGEREARELERQIHTLNYENPYSGSAFDGYTEWRTIPKHDLEQILTTYGFIKPH